MKIITGRNECSAVLHLVNFGNGKKRNSVTIPDKFFFIPTNFLDISSDSTPAMDDLLFDIARLKQKCEVLQGDKNILLQELEISKSTNGASFALDSMREEIQKKNDLLKNYVNNFTHFSNKLVLVRRYLEFEKNTINDVKADMEAGILGVVEHVTRQVEIITRSYSQLEKRCQVAEEKCARLVDERNIAQDDLSRSLETTSTLQKILNTIEESHSYERQQHVIVLEEISRKCDEQIIEKNDAMLGLQEYIKQIETQREAMQADAAILNARVQSISNNLSNQSVEFNREKLMFLTNKEQMEKCIANLNGENKALAKSIESKDKELHNLRRNIEVMTQSQDEKLVSLSLTCSNYMKQLESMRESEEKTKQDYESQLSNLKTELKRYQDNVEELQDTIESKTKEYMELTGAYVKVQGDYQTAEDSRKQSALELKKETHRLEQLLREVSKEKDTAIRERVLSESRCRELSNSVHELNQTVHELQDRLKKETVKCTDTEAMCNGLEKELAMIKDEKRDWVKARQEHVLALKEEEEQRVQLQVTNTSLKKANHELQERVDRLVARIDEREGKGNEGVQFLQAQVAGYEKEVSDLKRTIHKECEERTLFLIEIAELKERLKRLDPSLVSAVSEGEGGRVVKEAWNTRVFPDPDPASSTPLDRVRTLQTKSSKVMPLTSAGDEVGVGGVAGAAATVSIGGAGGVGTELLPDDMEWQRSMAGVRTHRGSVPGGGGGVGARQGSHRGKGRRGVGYRGQR